ncbi:PREDICTED: beta-D-glucosyl crocetin beta-1,6-glucosyltransferase-like [Ipomoea nil]|uniref:beta-D-glucosyl crocetin beta-1,6-glucosyltransferase-like n=1 Tax=Ipomoea nil TaxID=35883 RepID=UPI000901DE70|nr:PREDICTED: beta-D-glucosyl crocetin beta-1,6-glucosyltransferase-like [Ipomoea nil]
MGTETMATRRSVVMFPWLAYGHITPFVGLAKNLADRGFLVHLCSTPDNLNSIKNNIPQSYSQSIRLLELHLPESPDLPPHYQTTNGLPLHLHDALKKVLKMAEPDFTELLKTLNPDLLIHDVVNLWAEKVALSLNIPSVRFFTASAAMCSYFTHMLTNPGAEYPFPALRLRQYEQTKTRELMNQETRNFKREETLDTPANQAMMLVNSSREVEGKYIDYLSELMKSKVVSIGTTFQAPPPVDHETELTDWLARKPASSTVFVSFGSEYFLRKEDLEEIAYGLEISGVNFIWVLRFPKGEEISVEEALPKGFLERIGERGRMVEGWAPQAKILGHRSTGGFVSHCGWNSIMESLNLGVPIIAMPMHLDQPMNARLMVEIGAAVEVERDEKGKLHREEMAAALRETVGGENGEKLKRNVKRISENLRLAGNREMDAVVAELEKLCNKPERIAFAYEEN